MAQKHRNNHERKRGGPSSAARGAAPKPPVVYERTPPLIYGQPVLILEDLEKNTFEFKAGNWVPHGTTIAECRVIKCQIKELAQKVNQMTRYEVRYPLPAAT